MIRSLWLRMIGRIVVHLCPMDKKSISFVVGPIHQLYLYVVLDSNRKQGASRVRSQRITQPEGPLLGDFQRGRNGGDVSLILLAARFPVA